MQLTAKLGRNDACHCGSGKKYKKCHLPAEEAESADAARKASEAREARERALNRWSDFNKAVRKADFAGKETLLRELLVGEELPESHYLLTWFDLLWEAAEATSERNAFCELVDLLESRHVEVFNEMGNYLPGCRVTAALREGRKDDLTPLFLAYTEASLDELEFDFEGYMTVSNHLAYFGHLDVLLTGFRACRAGMKESEHDDSEVPHAIARRGVICEVLSALGSNPPGTEFPSGLLDRVRYFEDWDRDRLAGWIHLLDADASHWRREEFAVGLGEMERDPDLREGVEENLEFLTHAFLGYLRRAAGYTWSRAELASAALYQLLLDRVEGYFPENSARRGISDYWKDKSIWVLCPSPDLLEAHVDELLEDALPRDEFRALALCEGLPHWFAFLVRMGLVTETESRPILDTLSPVMKKVLDAVQA